MSCVKKMITLMGSDGDIIKVDEAVAFKFGTIKSMLDSQKNEEWMVKGVDNKEWMVKGVGAEKDIFLPMVTTLILNKLMEYCRKHVEDAKDSKKEMDGDSTLKAWDAGFIKVIKEEDVMYEIIVAADYLVINGLLDLTCQTVIDEGRLKLRGGQEEELAG